MVEGVLTQIVGICATEDHPLAARHLPYHLLPPLVVLTVLLQRKFGGEKILDFAYH